MILSGYRVQVQNLLQLQQAPRGGRDLVAHWGVRTGQAQREKEERALAVSGLETVALKGEKVTQMVHPRVRCWFGVDRVRPMQIAPPRRFL
jgi:hypothetical protein